MYEHQISQYEALVHRSAALTLAQVGSHHMTCNSSDPIMQERELIERSEAEKIITALQQQADKIQATPRGVYEEERPRSQYVEVERLRYTPRSSAQSSRVSSSSELPRLYPDDLSNHQSVYDEILRNNRPYDEFLRNRPTQPSVPPYIPPVQPIPYTSPVLPNIDEYYPPGKTLLPHTHPPIYTCCLGLRMYHTVLQSATSRLPTPSATPLSRPPSGPPPPLRGNDLLSSKPPFSPTPQHTQPQPRNDDTLASHATNLAAMDIHPPITQPRSHLSTLFQNLAPPVPGAAALPTSTSSTPSYKYPYSNPALAWPINGI